MGELRAYEEVLARALTSSDPVAALSSAATDPRLSPETRSALTALDPDGVRISAMMVARLRFERLIQGSSHAATWFDTDPRGFTRAFKRFHGEVPADAAMPGHEGCRFQAWAERAIPRAGGGGVSES